MTKDVEMFMVKDMLRVNCNEIDKEICLFLWHVF